MIRSPGTRINYTMSIFVVGLNNCSLFQTVRHMLISRRPHQRMVSYCQAQHSTVLPMAITHQPTPGMKQCLAPLPTVQRLPCLRVEDSFRSPVQQPGTYRQFHLAVDQPASMYLPSVSDIFRIHIVDRVENCIIRIWHSIIFHQKASNLWTATRKKKEKKKKQSQHLTGLK